ncbi:MAG: cytochrome c oxidase assembly protein [Robiginitomaculum sp.]|nr:cytochrome c oxidase assembly protein [Robiginitomaculum sp.]
MSAARQHNSNRKLVMSLSAAALAMLGLGFASKPLYDAFCRVTGYGGTTRVAEQMSEIIVDREIKVRFDSNVASNLGWTFKPDEIAMTVKLGQNALAYYSATNDTQYPIVGTASYNVSPIKAAPYFSKLECFCFTEQTLKPGESVEMPVSFFVDPEVVNDKNLKQITTITLSYTFYEADIGQTETTDVSTNTTPASGETSQKPVVN